MQLTEQIRICKTDRPNRDLTCYNIGCVFPTKLILCEYFTDTNETDLLH